MRNKIALIFASMSNIVNIYHKKVAKDKYDPNTGFIFVLIFILGHIFASIIYICNHFTNLNIDWGGRNKYLYIFIFVIICTYILKKIYINFEFANTVKEVAELPEYFEHIKFWKAVTLAYFVLPIILELYCLISSIFTSN